MSKYDENVMIARHVKRYREKRAVASQPVAGKKNKTPEVSNSLDTGFILWRLLVMR